MISSTISYQCFVQFLNIKKNTHYEMKRDILTKMILILDLLH